MKDIPSPDEIKELQRMQTSVNDELRKFQELQESVLPSNTYSFSSLEPLPSSARVSCEIIMEHIKKFENTLDNDHEVAIKLASFGQSITLSVIRIGYSDPNTLVFYGYVGEQPATLIQHMSQLNFLLLAAPKADPKKPVRRVKLGFHDRSEN